MLGQFATLGLNDKGVTLRSVAQIQGVIIAAVPPSPPSCHREGAASVCGACGMDLPTSSPPAGDSPAVVTEEVGQVLSPHRFPLPVFSWPLPGLQF